MCIIGMDIQKKQLYSNGYIFWHAKMMYMQGLNHLNCHFHHMVTRDL